MSDTLNDILSRVSLFFRTRLKHYCSPPSPPSGKTPRGHQKPNSTGLDIRRYSSQRINDTSRLLLQHFDDPIARRLKVSRTGQLEDTAAQFSPEMSTDNHTSNKRSLVARLPLFGTKPKDQKSALSDEDAGTPTGAPKWSFGVLNDKATVEVPGKCHLLLTLRCFRYSNSFLGSVLLLSKDRNEPLGLRNTPARTSHSSIATGNYPAQPSPRLEKADADDKKKTADGKVILEPQPEDSANDPLNWPTWRRDAALLSLGIYCMVGG